MAFTNPAGITISLECSALIKELKADIAEFGGNKIVAVWCKEESGVELYTNYDFIVNDDKIKKSELEKGEYIKKMTMSALLVLLEEQNKIL